MANPSSGDPAKDLIGDWNLAESADDTDALDSLLAFTDPGPATASMRVPRTIPGVSARPAPRTTTCSEPSRSTRATRITT